MEEYTKPPLTIDKQLELLKSRGVIVTDDTFALHILANVSYYRLTAYLYPFRKKDGSDMFEPGTSIEKIWRYYRFDRKMRFLLIDAIERIEVAVKALLANHFTLTYGAFGYNDITNFATKADVKRHSEMLTFIDTEITKSKEDFILHFKKKYDTSKGLPLWMATEIMTFGNILTFFRLMKKKDKQVIANPFGIPEQVFETWLLSLHYIRNVCAHHGRVWNRKLAVSPCLPKKLSEWHEEKFQWNNHGFIPSCQFQDFY